jgi:hypothetical protein
VGKIAAMMDRRRIPNITGDNPAVAQAYGQLVIMVPEKSSPKAADTDPPREVAVMDQIRIKDLPDQYILPGGAAVSVGFQDVDLLMPERPITGQPCQIGVEALQLGVPDIILIFPRRKVLGGYKIVAIPDIFKHGIHIQSISLPNGLVYLACCPIRRTSSCIDILFPNFYTNCEIFHNDI